MDGHAFTRASPYADWNDDTFYTDDHAVIRTATDFYRVTGIIATASTGPHAGAIYCVGPDSTVSGSSMILHNLSKLASCPNTASGDHLSGCLR